MINRIERKKRDVKRDFTGILAINQPESLSGYNPLVRRIALRHFRIISSSKI